MKERRLRKGWTQRRDTVHDAETGGTFGLWKLEGVSVYDGFQLQEGHTREDSGIGSAKLGEERCEGGRGS